jgi:S1-C subfamily serine protease
LARVVLPLNCRASFSERVRLADPGVAEQDKTPDLLLQLFERPDPLVIVPTGLIVRIRQHLVLKIWENAWRTWRGGQIDRLIRPDVRLYRGQEGSALVNEHHRVLGINSPDLARNAVITVPAQTIDRVVDAILASGHVPRPFLGLAMQAVPVPQPQRSHFAQGAEQVLLVLHVEPNAPGATGGVLVGDLVVSLNGNPVYSVREFLHRLASLRVGDSASLVVVRGGARIDLTLHVGDRG